VEDPDSTPSAVLPAELDDAADQAVGAPASTKIETTKGRASALVRLVTHVSVVAPFAFAAIVLMRRGWFAEGDGAVITARSFEVFTAHSPLVGQLTWLRAPGIFDLGPLEYWLITLPVHLDPRNGALWGSALMCALAASLAVEACRAAAGAIGGVTAALVTVGTLCWMPSLAYSPMWNPHFGEMWFLAAIGCSFAVLCGRIGFLPLLVLAASVAMQSHLMFAAAGAALGVLGLAVGLVTIRRTGNGTRWWIASVAVGIACWAAPLAQELTASRGNLTLLLSGSHTHYRVAFGLQALSRASAPPWQWLGSISTHPDNLNALLTSAPVWPAAVVLVLSVAMFPLASLLKSRALMALATVNVVLVLNLVLYFGDIPSSVKRPAHSAG
jgi:hypothetical protein